MNATMGKEIELNTMNDSGVLTEITKTISEKGVSILAAHGRSDGTRGVYNILTDDNLRASDALRARRFEPFEVPVVICEVGHKPGMLSRIADRVQQAGVEIRRFYATAPNSCDRALVVLSTSNDAKAIVAINKEKLAD